MAGWLIGCRSIVTGGASGIGRAVVRRFVEEGAMVVVIDRDAEKLGELKEELGARCEILEGDAADPDAVNRCVDLIIDRFGGIDTVVGNAGVFDWYRRVDRMDGRELLTAFNELFAINVASYLLIARAAYPHLKASRGSLILTCSIASFRGGGGGALYTASKFAARGLVYQLAQEWAPDIRVNGVAPGGTVTALAGLAALGSHERHLGEDPRLVDAVAKSTPLGFVAEPADHAGAYVLLASAVNSRSMTGSIIVSDGGILACV
jgi:NAD(P)-dependent dehydrogenase (short-subunit alcohol dehydrogenase family)